MKLFKNFYNILVFSVILLGVFYFNSQTAYAAPKKEASVVQTSGARNHQEAVDIARAQCGSTQALEVLGESAPRWENPDYGIGIYPIATSVNSNGVLSIETRVVYLKCTSTRTSLFAVTGYPTGGEGLDGSINFCPNVGWYGDANNPNFKTHDCVKYIGEVGSSDYRFHSIRLNKNIPPGVILAEYEPPLGSVRTANSLPTEVRISGYSQSYDGEVNINTGRAVCAFWYKNSGSISEKDRRHGLCQPLGFNVKWKTPRDLSGDLNVSKNNRTPAAVNKNMDFKHGETAYFPFNIRNSFDYDRTIEWINVFRVKVNEDVDPNSKSEEWLDSNGVDFTVRRYQSQADENPEARDFEPNQTRWYLGSQYNNVEVINSVDVGKKICYKLQTGFRSYRIDGDTPANQVNSSWACARVIRDFTLDPDIKINSGHISNQANTRLSLLTSVSNRGTTPSVSNTVWKLGYVLARNNITARDDLRTTSNNICSIGAISGASEFCGDVTGETAGAMRVGGNNIDTSGLKPTNTGAGRAIVRRNIELGQYVCYYLAVKPHATAANQNEWRVAIDCKPVAKTPSVHVFGGDVALRNTNLSKYLVDISNFKDNADNIYGSWIEYALISAGRVNKNNSSAGYSLSGVVDSPSSRSNLIFANTDSACNVAIGVGCFANRSSVDLAFKSTGSKTAPSMGSEDDGNSSINGFDHNKLYTRTSTSSVSIQGEVRGRSVVNASGKIVKITRNITNKPVADNYSQIPQLIIFAKEVQILSNVTNVDAWILATGNVFTCDNKTRPANSNECSNPLRVNGAIQAQKLYLGRTAGGDANSMNQAAEVINLSATSRLSAIGRAEDTSSGPGGSTGGSVWETTFVRELPPRY